MQHHSPPRITVKNKVVAIGWTPDLPIEIDHDIANPVEDHVNPHTANSKTPQTAARMDSFAPLPTGTERGAQSTGSMQGQVNAYGTTELLLPPVVYVILPPATPPEQPAAMPRQSLTPVWFRPRLYRASGDSPIAGLTNAT